MPPLSHGQRSLWFLHHFAPGSGASNIAAAARVLSPVDEEALERAFQGLVDRHAALRTTFPVIDGEPSQEIAEHLELVLGARTPDAIALVDGATRERWTYCELDDLPTDHPHPAVRSVRGAGHDFAIAGETFRALTSLARRHGATPFMVLLAAFAAVLQHLTGQEDLAVGTPVAGRIRPETEPLIGLFAQTLVLRVDLGRAPSFLDLLGRVRESALAAHTHLICTLTETEHGLAGTLKYSRDLFEPTTIERLTDSFDRLLAEAVADPERPVAELAEVERVVY